MTRLCRKMRVERDNAAEQQGVISNLMSTVAGAVLLCLFTVSPVQAAMDLNDVRVSGQFLGGTTLITQSNHSAARSERHQFDYAANIDFEFALSDKLSGILQLQTSPGGGALGFPGPGAELTDVNLVYAHSEKSRFTLGSFDTPFGQQTAKLSNNADTFNNALLFNDLMYSVFAGPMGTLNTLGVMGDYAHDDYAITWALSNGSSETAANSDGGFEYVIGGSTTALIPNTSLGASYMAVNELGNAESQFKSDFSAWIVDAQIQVCDSMAISAYYATLTFGDNDAATEDEVVSWMLEGKKSLSDKLFVAARISTWQPKDKDGNGSGMSTALPAVGFASATETPGSTAIVVDQEVSRYQIGLGYALEENLLLRADVFQDNYSHDTAAVSTDVSGGMLYVNAAF